MQALVQTAEYPVISIGYNTVWTVLCECNEHNTRQTCVVAYLFHDHSPDGDRHPSILLCKLLAVTRATKLSSDPKQSH